MYIILRTGTFEERRREKYNHKNFLERFLTKHRKHYNMLDRRLINTVLEDALSLHGNHLKIAIFSYILVDLSYNGSQIITKRLLLLTKCQFKSSNFKDINGPPCEAGGVAKICYITLFGYRSPAFLRLLIFLSTLLF